MAGCNGEELVFPQNGDLASVRRLRLSASLGSTRPEQPEERGYEEPDHESTGGGFHMRPATTPAQWFGIQNIEAQQKREGWQRRRSRVTVTNRVNAPVAWAQPDAMWPSLGLLVAFKL